MTNSVPRTPRLEETALTPEQQAVYDSIRAGPRGVVEGPLRVWLQSPGLAEKAQALGAFCRYRTSLPPRLSELAIITTGAIWRSGFEWAVHAPLAEAAGLRREVVEAIRRSEIPDFESEDEAIVHAFAVELHTRRAVGDATFSRARDLLGNAGLVELVGILGYYTLISMTINVFAVAPPAGSADPFASADDNAER